MLRSAMHPASVPGAALFVALLAPSCAPPRVAGRPTIAHFARSDDPWLLGARCAPSNRAEPRVEVLARGTGEPAELGETVRVHYVASLPSGVVLHDTHEENMPSEIIIGSTKVICGFERSLIGMRPGEQRRVLVPASLAFGQSERPPAVPPDTDLVFVIDLYLPAYAGTKQSGAAPPNPFAHASSVLTGSPAQTQAGWGNVPPP
jgi:hypothetical protein